MRVWSLRNLAPILITVGACSVSVDLDDRACPCGDGWVCDDQRSVCVPSAVGICARPGATPGSVAIDDFRFAYATGESIRVEWDIADDSELLRFEVDLADREEQLNTPGEFRTITSETNPELGRMFLPRAMDIDPVRATTVRELENRLEPYFARLVVFDTSGGVSCSQSVAAQTTVNDDERLVLIEDDIPRGRRQPVCIQFQPDRERSFMNSAGHHEYVVQCSLDGCTDDGRTTCFENVRFQELGIDASQITMADFRRAYLEMAVAVEGSEAFWSELGVTVSDGTTNRTYSVGTITLRTDGNYHVYQVPLREMDCRREDCGMATPLTSDAFTRITGFRVGSEFRSGARVRVDAVSVRW